MENKIWALALLFSLNASLGQSLSISVTTNSDNVRLTVYDPADRSSPLMEGGGKLKITLAWTVSTNETVTVQSAFLASQYCYNNGSISSFLPTHYGGRKIFQMEKSRDRAD